VVEPDAVKSMLIKPPPQVKKSLVFNCVPQSAMLGTLLNTDEQTPADLLILKDMCTKGMDYLEKAIEYIASLKLNSKGELNMMEVYEHCLYIMMFKNTLTAERREKLKDQLLPLIFTRLSFMPIIPSETLSNLLGINKAAQVIRAQIKAEIMTAHNLDSNREADNHLADLYVKLLILNSHAPGAKLEKIVKPALRENWDWIKEVDDPTLLFNFIMDACRVWPSPVDCNWVATQDYTLDFPNVEPILIPKGFFLTAAYYAIHFDEKLNPEPYKVKVDRDYTHNYTFNSPMNQKPAPGARECPGRFLSQALLPLILRKYISLKKDHSPAH